MRVADQSGSSILEVLISLTVLVLAMGAIGSLLFQNARINKSQQMIADVQNNARGCLELIVQKLRSAGWDPSGAGFPSLTLDPDLTDAVSQIEVFADLNADGDTADADEQMTIRHNGNVVQWRRSPLAAYSALAVNISNDADGDGTPEPLFTPIPDPDPTRIQVRVTAQSPVPDPVTRQIFRYTVTSDVVLRKAL